MAQISVKHKCGDNVSLSGIDGRVTAIFIRGRGRVYEFSYIDSDGNPKSCNVEECELEDSKPRPLGFGKDS